MKWLILLVGVVVVCLVVALVLGLIGGGMGGAGSSLRHEPLPDEPISDGDFDELTFDVAARGYRMSQVDGVVDRLRRELREKDEQIAVLLGDDATGSTAGPGEPAASEMAAPEMAEEVETGESAESAESAERAEGARANETVGRREPPA